MQKWRNKFAAALVTVWVLAIPASASAAYGNTYDSCCNVNDCCQDYQFCVFFDPMAVKPCQMNLEFAETIATTPPVESAPALEVQNDYFLCPEWSFGFRLGFEMGPQCGNWNVRAAWTWWENDTTGHVSVAPPVGTTVILDPKIAETESVSVPVANPNTASTKTKLEYTYNLLDVTAGWTCNACCGLNITPYGGFRGFWYTTRVDEVTAQDPQGVFSTTGDLSFASNDYNAYGIVGGLRFDFNFCNNFGFYGNFGGSLVAGTNDNYIEFFANGNSPARITQNESLCLFIHSLEGSFGLKYDWCYCDYNGWVGLGYEVIQWNEVLPHPFRQNSTNPGTATMTSNGLFVQSVAARLGMCF